MRTAYEMGTEKNLESKTDGTNFFLSKLAQENHSRGLGTLGWRGHMGKELVLSHLFLDLLIPYQSVAGTKLQTVG